MITNFNLKPSQEYTNVPIYNNILLKLKHYKNYIYNFYICYQIFIKL